MSGTWHSSLIRVGPCIRCQWKIITQLNRFTRARRTLHRSVLIGWIINYTSQKIVRWDYLLAIQVFNRLTLVKGVYLFRHFVHPMCKPILVMHVFIMSNLLLFAQTYMMSVVGRSTYSGFKTWLYISYHGGNAVRYIKQGLLHERWSNLWLFWYQIYDSTWMLWGLWHLTDMYILSDHLVGRLSDNDSEDFFKDLESVCHQVRGLSIAQNKARLTSEPQPHVYAGHWLAIDPWDVLIAHSSFRATSSKQYGRNESRQNRPKHAKPTWNVNTSGSTMYSSNLLVCPTSKFE